MEEDVKDQTVGQETTEAESSPAVTEDPATQQVDEERDPDQEIAEDLAKQEESEDTESEEGEESSEEDDAETDPEEADDTEEQPEEPKKGAEARKEQLQTEIRELVAKRNELRDEVTRINSQVYAPQTPEELVEQGMDPAMARVEALEQRTQMAEYNAHVTDLNANINIEALQVMADFPVFNPDAPEYDQALAERARQVYEQSAQIQTDPQTGLIVQANALPYQTYKTIAEIAQQGTQKGAIKGQKAAEKNLAAADPVPVSAPAEPKEDPFLKGLSG